MNEDILFMNGVFNAREKLIEEGIKIDDCVLVINPRYYKLSTIEKVFDLTCCFRDLGKYKLYEIMSNKDFELEENKRWLDLERSEVE